MTNTPSYDKNEIQPIKGKIVVFALLACAAVLGIGGVFAVFAFYGPLVTGDGANPDDGKQVEFGQVVYKANCAACHGSNLEGQPNWRARNPEGRLPAPPHDDTGHTSHHPDIDLFQITKNGVKPPLAPEGYKSDMPSFEGILSDKEIWAVLSYIKSKWSPNILARQNRMNRAYEK